MAAPSPAESLQSVLDTADILSGFLGDFEVTSAHYKPPPKPPPQPKPKKPPPLALPRTRTLHFPANKVKMSLAITEHLRGIYVAKIKKLRRIAQEQYTHLCRSLPKGDFTSIADLLRKGYRASEDEFAQQAIDACLDAHDLAGRPCADPSLPQIKKPFDRTMVAIFEYIFDQPDGKYISTTDKRRLAQLSGMAERQITVWFQNRRARTKQKTIAGKTPEPMTLEKALIKLRADCEKARVQKATSNGFQEITFRKTEKVLIEDIDDDIDEDTDVLCPRDQHDHDLRHLYATGELPNLDKFQPHPNSYPKPFVALPAYSAPRFEAPVWPRANQQLSSKPLVQVTKQEIQSLAKIFDDVMELQKTRTVVTKRRVTFPLPLPPAVQEAVARREARKLRNGNKRRPVVAQPHRENDINLVSIQAVTSNAEEILDTDQVQITEPELETEDATEQQDDQAVETAVVQQPYVAPPLPPTMSDLAGLLSRADLDKQPPPSDINTDPGSSSSPLAIPPLAPLLVPPTDPQEPAEIFIADHIVEAHSVNPTNYPPIINREPDCIPLAGAIANSESMIEALKVTLTELNIPIPENIDEPFIFNYAPSLAPNPAESCLHFLKDVYRGQADDIFPPEDAAIMHVQGNINCDPNTFIVPPPPSASAPFPYFPFGQAVASTQGADNGDSALSDQLYDSEGTSLPFALMDPAIQSLGIPITCEIPSSDIPYDGESMLSPVALLYHSLDDVDTNPELVLDQDFDSRVSALPFILTHGAPVDHSLVGTGQIPIVEQETLQGEVCSFHDQNFPDSYMFFAPPPSQVEDSIESSTQVQVETQPLSIYPSHLPHLPLIPKGLKKAARRLHSWLDKVTGIKLPFIDPEEMLQYLA